MLEIDRRRPLQGMERVHEILLGIVRYWLPVTLWLLFAFFLSSGTFSTYNTFPVVSAVVGFLFPRLTPDQVEVINWTIRKWAHVLQYFVLGLLLFRAFRARSAGGWTWRWTFFAVLGVFLLALADEFHQSFVPTRTSSIMDVGIDTAGGALAQYVAFLWYRCLGRRSG